MYYVIIIPIMQIFYLTNCHSKFLPSALSKITSFFRMLPSNFVKLWIFKKRKFLNVRQNFSRSDDDVSFNSVHF